jgi:beta-glucosidase
VSVNAADSWVVVVAVIVAIVGVGMAPVAAAGCARGQPSGGRWAPLEGAGAGQDPERRAAALVARMTLEEKVGQLVNAAPAIPRLGVPAYDWWSEALHGVARSGRATVFPQVIGLAATFDEDLIRRIAHAAAIEARAKFRAAGAQTRGSRRYGGLTFFAPNVNIYRDPRWGRGQETFGEDPYLTSRLGVAYVRGLQGDDPARLDAAAVGKHFAVHSGPEIVRHSFDARASARDLADTYLPQFEALVREGRVAGIMAAYNRVNGSPAVSSRELLAETLRGRWGFRGFVVGDCGAVQDLVDGHRVASDRPRAAAQALGAGTDLDCGGAFGSLVQAVRAGHVAEAQVDRAAIRLFAVRIRLGLFDHDPPHPPPGAGADAEAAERVLGSPAHRALAREAAQKSMVLLENDGALPIAGHVRRIAVVGPTADDRDVLLGNYHGTPDNPVTPLAGIRAAARRRGIAVSWSRGTTLAGRSRAEIGDAVAAARHADLVIAVLGLSPRLEGEEGEPGSLNPAGDRRELGLPGGQPALLEALLDAGKPTVVVLTGGGAMALPETRRRRPAAVLVAWYPGEAGGEALADLLFGDASPSGRLPLTFYRRAADLPPFDDYRMAGRTYRYFAGQALYPFGAGRGYGAVRYLRLELAAGAGGAARAVKATVENASDRAIEEVVTVYAIAAARQPHDPLRELVGFHRITLGPRETKTADVPLSARAFTRIDEQGTLHPPAGTWRLHAGDAPPIDVSF